MIRKFVFILLWIPFHSLLCQTKEMDSLRDITLNYHRAYELDGKYDENISHKVESYYLKIIEKDSVNKEIYDLFNRFYMVEFVFLLKEQEKYQMGSLARKKVNINQKEIEKKYRDQIDSYKRFIELYIRRFPNYKPENSEEYTPDPFYLDNKPK